jgi:GTPase SAR1 family protein
MPGPCYIRSILCVQKRAKDREIERGMNNEWMEKQREIKLLLLGTGESGKSTVLKQMQIIYAPKDKPAFDKVEAAKYTGRIRLNILEFVKALCEAACDLEMDSGIQNEEEFKFFLADERIQELPQGQDLERAFETSRLVELQDVVLSLWEDPGIQAVWARRSEFQIIDSHTKYFERMRDVACKDYVPTVDDILLCRTRTTGINTVQLDIADVNEVMNTFYIYDVGGQRNERRKWIHCFEDVTAVIFVAALSEFDQVLLEDSRQNRMVEAIEIFHQQLTSQWFANSAMILFLNKEDLFEGKLKTKDIKAVDEWDDFSGSLWSNCDQVRQKTSDIRD